MSKSRAYCFTINNPVESDYINVRSLFEDSKYGIYGKETGEEGTFHLQGYVYFENARHFKKVKEYIPRAHIEVAKGSPEQNVTYCSKQGDIVEYGDRPVQGRRNDISEAYKVVKETSKMKAVVETMPTFQAIKCAEAYLKYHEKPRDWKPEVRWYFGATGEGKTRAAREWLGEDVYTTLEDGKFWEGYDGHECVLIDDFRKDFCKFHVLLRLLDRYEYRVEVKGSSRQLRARKIAITCPFHPRMVYETREDVGQLIRRIDQILHVRDGVCTVDGTL